MNLSSNFEETQSTENPLMTVITEIDDEMVFENDLINEQDDGELEGFYKTFLVHECIQ